MSETASQFEKWFAKEFENESLLGVAARSTKPVFDAGFRAGEAAAFERYLKLVVEAMNAYSQRSSACQS